MTAAEILKAARKRRRNEARATATIDDASVLAMIPREGWIRGAALAALLRDQGWDDARGMACIKRLAQSDHVEKRPAPGVKAHSHWGAPQEYRRRSG